MEHLCFARSEVLGVGFSPIHKVKHHRELVWWVIDSLVSAAPFRGDLTAEAQTAAIGISDTTRWKLSVHSAVTLEVYDMRRGYMHLLILSWLKDPKFFLSDWMALRYSECYDEFYSQEYNGEPLGPITELS